MKWYISVRCTRIYYFFNGYVNLQLTHTQLQYKPWIFISCWGGRGWPSWWRWAVIIKITISEVFSVKQSWMTATFYRYTCTYSTYTCTCICIRCVVYCVCGNTGVSGYFEGMLFYMWLNICWLSKIGLTYTMYSLACEATLCTHMAPLSTYRLFTDWLLIVTSPAVWPPPTLQINESVK